MKTYVITCTGGRPEALKLCNHYMARQGHQDFEWIVIEDGAVVDSKGPRRANVFYQSAPSEPGEITLVRNLRTALGHIGIESRKHGPGLIIIVEDDDWYHAGYVGMMQSYAENLPPGKMLFGESNTRYYNVRWRTYRHNDNAEHASLCSTCFTTEFLPHMAKIIMAADPQRPFIDVTAFAEHADKAILFPSDLVCGIKGMPGRKGIGHGHTEGIKRITRDPYMEVLQDWIGEDVWRYREFYHDEEMRDVPIPEEQKHEPWAIQELEQRDEGKKGICGIFRQPGIIPPLEPFAAGAFANGYLNEFRDISDAKRAHFPEFDLVVVSGGLLRHGGLNGVVHEHYRSLGIPVVICDPGRLIRGTQRIYINKEGWLPPELPGRERVHKLDLAYAPKPRGEDILVIGQRPDLDNQLKSAIRNMKRRSGRRVVYRPHPNMYHEHQRDEYDVPYDELSIGGDRIDSKSKTTLQKDLDRAWCVITHSSIVAVTAILRGIQVVASPEIVCSDVVWYLKEWDSALNDDNRPDWDEVNKFLRKWSYTVWFERELRSGEAFAYLKQFIKKEQ